MESLYNEAYACIEQGICYDEVNDSERAKLMYEKGLKLIEDAAQLKSSSEEGQKLIAKMQKARSHILERMKSFDADESTTSSATPFDHISATLVALGESRQAEEVLCIQEAQIFFVQNDNAGVPSYPEPLKIFKFLDNTHTLPDSKPGGELYPNLPKNSEVSLLVGFLQVGDWVYPLTRQPVPVLHTAYGAYMFVCPTKEPGEELSVGIILPADLEVAQVQLFESTIRELCDLRQQSVEEEQKQLSADERERVSHKIAKFLIQTGELVAWGLEKGAEKGGKFISSKGEQYREGKERTQEPMQIDPRVQTSVHYLRKGGKVAVKVSGYILNKIGDIALDLGRKFSGSAEKCLSERSETTGKLLSDCIEIGGGGIAGVATVWMSLENAGKTLGKNIANETVQVVDLKYGQEAAQLTDNSLRAAGHGTMTVLNVRDLGPKAIAKRTARKAGLGLLQDLSKTSKSIKGSDDTISSGSVKPPRPEPPQRN